MRRFTLPHRGAMIIGIVLLGHLIVGGGRAAERGLWLLTRHAPLESRENEWFRRSVPAHSAVATINAAVPSDAKLIVSARTKDVALEVAFYCFPRPVVFRQSEEEQLHLEYAGENSWVVRIPIGE